MHPISAAVEEKKAVWSGRRQMTATAKRAYSKRVRVVFPSAPIVLIIFLDSR